MSRLPIQATARPAVTITPPAVKTKTLVYIGVANKAMSYPKGRSRIVYIGTTETGATRIAHSAALKAQDLLPIRGISRLEFYVVTCKSVSSVKTWQKLERGLLITFREIFGKPPLRNKTGQAMRWRDENKYFTHDRLRSVIEKYS